MTTDWQAGVGNAERVAAVEATGLIGTGPEDAFDRLVELAAQLTGAERCCITFVDADSWNYKTTVGLGEGTPTSGDIEDSFCRYVVGWSRPLVVTDAREDPRVFDTPAIELFGVAAWVGYPIEDSNGVVLGTFCLIDSKPREWTDQDILILATLAKAASTEVALMVSRAQTVALSAELEELRRSQQG